MRCRSWNCDLCQPDRQAQLIANARAGKPNTFITLTANPAEGRDPYERARGLADAWREVVKRAKKAWGYDHIPYLCVFEATKKGEPHLHILCRVRWISQKWLSAQMKELTNSPIVDIRRVDSLKQVSRYITKYIGKAPHRFETCKRYWQTRSYDLENYQKEPDDHRWSNVWEIRDVTFDFLRASWELWGWEVTETRLTIEGHARDPPQRLGGSSE